MADEERLKTGDVARRLGVSEQTIRNWIEQGRISAVRPGRDYLIARSELERIANDDTVKAELKTPETEIEDSLEERRRARDLPDAPAGTDAIQERFYAARDQWRAAVTAHRMAPPDAGFAGRLHDFATAARDYSEACLAAAKEGFDWPALESAWGPPYELQPGTGRRGPVALWVPFDEATAELGRVVGSRSMKAVGRTYADLADAALALHAAVEEEDGRSGLLGGSADPNPRGLLRRIGGDGR